MISLTMMFQCYMKGTFLDFYEYGKYPNFVIHNTVSTISEYDVTKNIFANSYPWLFPGGIGDMYDMTLGAPAQDLPKFQMPFLTPKSVQTC